jgi:hypothetical protein
MFKQLLFNCLSENNQMLTLRNKGIELRSYQKNGRIAHLYRLDNFYVEVIFKFDDSELYPENVKTFQNTEEWSSYLEGDNLK